MRGDRACGTTAVRLRMKVSAGISRMDRRLRMHAASRAKHLPCPRPKPRLPTSADSRSAAKSIASRSGAIGRRRSTQATHRHAPCISGRRRSYLKVFSGGQWVKLRSNTMSPTKPLHSCRSAPAWDMGKKSRRPAGIACQAVGPGGRRPNRHTNEGPCQGSYSCVCPSPSIQAGDPRLRRRQVRIAWNRQVARNSAS
jgi:hypothetical protein